MRPSRTKKRIQSCNLLLQLRDYEEDVLRFMEALHEPFTNNQGERDLRMTKVQQTISGSLRSAEGAKAFGRIRSYWLTCQKNDVELWEALTSVFKDDCLGFLLKKFQYLADNYE